VTDAGLLDQREVGSRIFAAVPRDFILDLLSFFKRAEASPLYSADVDEHVVASIAGLDESVTFLGIEPFDSSGRHDGLLMLTLITDLKGEGRLGVEFSLASLLLLYFDLNVR
jgi:hypothetical protein